MIVYSKQLSRGIVIYFIDDYGIGGGGGGDGGGYVKVCYMEGEKDGFGTGLGVYWFIIMEIME